MENRRKKGSRYESVAAVCLQQRGYTILERNFSSREGEIDLIARDGEYLVFVEVKYRANVGFGEPTEAVGFAKQEKIRKTAQYYLYKNQVSQDQQCRFDVVAILGDQVEVITNAF